jgi:hypothetical protein
MSVNPTAKEVYELLTLSSLSRKEILTLLSVVNVMVKSIPVKSIR